MKKKEKPKAHNEWFMALATKRRCPTCLGKGPVFAWGEYAAGRWRVIIHFCQGCFKEQVADRLRAHTKGCGCTVTFCARSGHSLPDFIKQEELLCQPPKLREAS